MRWWRRECRLGSSNINSWSSSLLRFPCSPPSRAKPGSSTKEKEEQDAMVWASQRGRDLHLNSSQPRCLARSLAHHHHHRLDTTRLFHISLLTSDNNHHHQEEEQHEMVEVGGEERESWNLNSCQSSVHHHIYHQSLLTSDNTHHHHQQREQHEMVGAWAERRQCGRSSFSAHLDLFLALPPCLACPHKPTFSHLPTHLLTLWYFQHFVQPNLPYLLLTLYLSQQQQENTLWQW